jgi:nitroimidazol reductase NimA-like FMN-containing flavoprotein (pyridoxamine 5'-phosphate oxidase superfamily)
MRKAGREIKDLGQIADLLGHCDTIRLGITDDGAPYVVPVSFGYEMADGTITVYFHGATEGRKSDLLKQHPRVCVEADICHRFVENGSGGITCDYESVIGYGNAELIRGAEAEKAIGLLVEHCGFPEYKCTEAVLNITAVYKVKLTEIAGKHRNLNNPNA